MKIKIIKSPFVLYTVLFLLLIPVIFMPFLLEGKTFVWYLDGLNQHLPLLKHYGKLLRDLLSGNGFPMIDFRLGLGYDTISTMHYYTIGDPLNLLTLCFTNKNSIFMYNLLVLLRYYLSGLSFIILGRYWRWNKNGIVLGAFIYIFCGYSLFSGVRHPFFMNPMIYLPLLLIGVEKVLRREKPYLMVIMVFISAISNFYFFYDLSVITVIYIVFRYVTTFRKTYNNVVKGFFLIGLRTCGYYLMGISLSAFIFLPVIYSFFNNGRLNNETEFYTGMFHYNPGYYLRFFQGLLAPGVFPGYWTELSFAPVVAVSFTILLCNRKYRQLRIVYPLSLLGLFIPAFGYFMNGFAYASNRWCFLISLLVAVSFAMTYEKIFLLERKEKIIMLMGILLYGVLAFAFSSTLAVKYTFIFLIFFFIIVCALQLRHLQNNKLLKEIIIIVLVLTSLGFNGYAFYSVHFNNYVSDFLSSEKIEKLTNKGILALIPDIEDSSFYRVDAFGDKVLNESLTTGYNDISSYYSLMDGKVTEYLRGTEVLSLVSACSFDSFDNRTVLNTLAGVKYFATTDKAAVPYGYQLIMDNKSGKLYQNLYVLPLGYTYNNYILKSDYDRLDSLQKQNALLNAVVLDNPTDYADMTSQNMQNGIEKLDVEIIPDKNVMLEKNTIRVLKKGATITLLFHTKSDCETYVKLTNLNLKMNENSIAGITVKINNGIQKSFNIKSVYYNSYFGKENYLINTGYRTAGESRVVITFKTKDEYSYNSIDAYSFDMNYYKTQVTALRKNVLQNIEQKKNKFQGNISLVNKGIMVLSIPYSSGWSAYVDGIKTKILTGNIMYMALPLEAGNHHIVLKYETPYFKTGCILSLSAFILLIVMFFCTHWRPRNGYRTQ